MVRQSVRACVVLVLAGAGSLLGVGRLAAGERPFDEIVPEETTVFFSVRSLSGAGAWFEASPLRDLWRRKEMEVVAGKAASFLALVTAGGETKGASILEDFKASCRGEVAFAQGRLNGRAAPRAQGDEETPEDLREAILLDVAADPDRAWRAVERLVERAVDTEKARRTREEFRGLDVLGLELPAASGKEPSAAYFSKAGDLLIGSGSKSFLEAILASRSQPGERSLSSKREYRDLREKVGKDSVLFAYVDLASVIQAELAGSEEEIPMGLAGAKALELLGLTALKAGCVAATLRDRSIDVTAFVSASSASEGLLKVFWTEPKAIRFSATIPEDASSAFVYEVDAGALHATIMGLVRYGVSMAEEMMRDEPSSGAPAERPDPIKAFEAQLGISLEQDVFGALSGRIVQYERIRKPFGERAPEGALLIDLRERERFQGALTKMLALVPLFRKSDYLGRTIYRFVSPFEADEEEEGPDSAGGGDIAFSVTENDLVIGYSSASVEEVIRRIGKDVRGLTDSPAFKAVARELPSSSTLVGFFSPDGIEYVIHAIKEMLLEMSSEREYADFDEAFLDEDEDLSIPSQEEPEDEFGVKRGSDAEGEEGPEEKAFRELVEAIPDAGIFTRYIAGAVVFGFSDERGFGYTARLVLKVE